MEGPTPEEVRRALAPLDARAQRVVVGLLTVMIREPTRVRNREWIGRQLTELVLATDSYEEGSLDEGVQAVQDYLSRHAAELLSTSYLLFQRVGLDLAPRASEGFTLEDAVRHAAGYLPSGAQDEPRTQPESACELGEQPLARLMDERELKPRDLVEASTEQLTHKMVTRAMRGRRLTRNTMNKVHRAWNLATGGDHARTDLFDYEP